MSKVFEALKRAELANRSRQRLAARQERSAPAYSVILNADSLERAEPETSANERLSRHSVKRDLIWFFLGVLFTSAAFTFLPHYARSVDDHRQAIEITSERKMPGIPSQSSPVEHSPQSLPTALSSRSSGFVLQVAALKHEDNAHALAETLHQMNFPAFVFKRGDDPFYRVALGVYGSADSAVRVKDDLETRGFEAILRPWLPE